MNLNRYKDRAKQVTNSTLQSLPVNLTLLINENLIIYFEENKTSTLLWKFGDKCRNNDDGFDKVSWFIILIIIVFLYLYIYFIFIYKDAFEGSSIYKGKFGNVRPLQTDNKIG